MARFEFTAARSFGIWVNKAQTWAYLPYTFMPRAFESLEAATAWLVASGFTNSTDATVHLGAYVTELLPQSSRKAA